MFTQENFAFKKYYLVENNMASSITIAAGNKYYFNDIPQLRNMYTYGLAVYGGTQLAQYNGNTVVPNNGLPSAVISLVEESTEEVYQMPLYDLISSSNGGYWRTFRYIKVNLVKSYVQLTATTNLTAGQSFMFGFAFSNARPVRK